jgi:hypothetical protein
MLEIVTEGWRPTPVEWSEKAAENSLAAEEVFF